MTVKRPVRLAVPLAVIGLLVWLMVGCIYIPTWERMKLTGTQRDFRGMIGSATSASQTGPRLVAGHVTRAQVIGVLGPPAYETADGRSVIYTASSSTGLYVIPLCLDLTSDREAQYAVRLDYGPTGIVDMVEAESVTNELRPVQLMYEGGRPHGELVNDEAAERLAGRGLRRTSAATGLPLHDSSRVPPILMPTIGVPPPTPTIRPADTRPKPATTNPFALEPAVR